MPENVAEQKPLPTIWRTSDKLWEIIEPILQEYDPPTSAGPPRVDQRAAFDAIIFRMRREISATRRGDGWWNVRWAGFRSVEPYW